MANINRQTVLIRGAGELASGVAITLFRTGFSVVLTELPYPLAIRRTVAFSDAILNGSAQVEGITAEKTDVQNFKDILDKNRIPILIDSMRTLRGIKPEFYVDARMLKSGISSVQKIARFNIGLGPGFQVGKNCDAIIETNRGHTLGKVIWKGTALNNTGVPGNIGGENLKRVIYAPSNGRVDWYVGFGDKVKMNQVVGVVGCNEIVSQIDGIVRGLISPQVDIEPGLKIGDVDPRGAEIDCYTISDKARCIGRGVLEAILTYLNR